MIKIFRIQLDICQKHISSPNFIPQILYVILYYERYNS